VRTHADTTLEGGLQSIEGLVEVRRRVADVIDVQVVALASWPISGPAGADLRALVRDAVAMGADLVGGCPHLEDDPAAANETLLALAAELDRPLDLHTDETLDPAMCSLADLARRVIRDRFPHAVTASHCVSLGMQPADQQRATAELVAEAAIGVVVLPQTNLYLQGRDHGTGTPRGLTAIRALREAGAPVAAGADNLQDPFNPVGRGDPLETASLMVMAGHQLPEVAYESVSTEARRVLGLAPAGLTPGASADLVAVRAATVREAVAFGPPGRLVIRHGHVVSTGERA
jgi:cytosine deaminase